MARYRAESVGKQKLTCRFESCSHHSGQNRFNMKRTFMRFAQMHDPKENGTDETTTSSEEVSGSDTEVDEESEADEE